MKLTEPQKALLKTAANDDRGYLDCVADYAPARKLVALGLAEVVQGKFSDRVRITPAGSAWLDEHDPDLLSEFCRAMLTAGRP